MQFIEFLCIFIVVLPHTYWFLYMWNGIANEKIWDLIVSFPINDTVDIDYKDIRDPDYYENDLFIRTIGKAAREGEKLGYMKTLRPSWDRNPHIGEPVYQQNGKRVHLIGYQLLGKGKVVLRGKKNRRDFNIEATRERFKLMILSPWTVLVLAIFAIIVTFLS